MSRGSLSELAQQVAGVLHGDDARFDGVSTDTRTIDRGMLFVALKGPALRCARLHRVALARGAAGALVQRRADTALPQVEVTDARMALGRHARGWRRRFDIPVVAVTGSNGKTTVKEMVAAILALGGATHATRGQPEQRRRRAAHRSRRWRRSHRSAVIELGTNHPGEIAYLAHLIEPTIGLVTNAGPAHLQGFGTVAAVAREKGALFAALRPEAWRSSTPTIRTSGSGKRWRMDAASCASVPHAMRSSVSATRSSASSISASSSNAACAVRSATCACACPWRVRTTR
jgi:UDP-N-acetylmuramoyl-tripeptide--D-alanyl-D-alanine ligase